MPLVQRAYTRRSRSARRIALVLVVVAGVGAAAVGCDERPSRPSTAPAPRTGAQSVVRAATVESVPVQTLSLPLGPRSTGPVRSYLLTGEAFDHYLVETDGTASEVVAAKSNVGGNTRLLWANLADPVANDLRVCATWERFTGLAQPGLGLRVRRDGNRTRAITVTDNIFWGARFGFNVHVWDTGQASWVPGRLPVVPVGGADLSATFGSAGSLIDLPWRVCARVKGRTLDIKVWPLADAEPEWGDVRYGRRFRLPMSAVYPGRAGWYAGHLRPGDDIVLSDQQVLEVE